VTMPQGRRRAGVMPSPNDDDGQTTAA